MKRSMKTYWALVAFIVEPGRERSSVIEFKAESQKKAVEAAARFARNRERAFREWTFCCVKVGVFAPAPIAADGALMQSHLPWFFEWKYDWPGTLEERVASLSNRPE
jgi:hypothetical protein